MAQKAAKKRLFHQPNPRDRRTPNSLVFHPPPSSVTHLPREVSMMNEPRFVYSPQDNELQFLTDSAFSSLFDDPSSVVSSKGKRAVDGLFMERLESFIEGQLKDIEIFANREQVPVRKLVAIPHAKYVLSLDVSFPSMNETPAPNEKKSVAGLYTIKSTLARLSNVLQLLHTSTGLDSLLLVVSPQAMQGSTTKNDNNQSETLASEASWIGGTEIGKEFWMGLKGGGLNGARAFRLKSQSRYQEENSTPDTSNIEAFVDVPKSMPTLAATPPVSYRSSDVKTELNAIARQALRSASGNPSAEMRWTKPAALEELYGVRLIGWPVSTGHKNPSNNTVKENRLLLDLLRNNQIRFITKGSPEWQIEESKVEESTSPTIPAPTPSSSRQYTITANDGTGELLPHSYEPELLDTERPEQVPSIPTTDRPRKRARATE